MNEKIKYAVIAFLAGLAVGGAGAAIYAGTAASGEISFLNRRYDQLNREYTERQRELEEQQRIVRDGVAECLGYAENARAVIERTGENAGRAVGNLKEASALIKQGIEERENLKMELDNLRAGLLGLGNLAGLDAEQVNQGSDGAAHKL